MVILLLFALVGLILGPFAFREDDMLAGPRARAFSPSTSWVMQSRLRRAYATVQSTDLNAPTLPESLIYVSTSTSPYYNLSLEDW